MEILFLSYMYNGHFLQSNLLAYGFCRTKLSLTRWSADWKSATVLYEQAGSFPILTIIPWHNKKFKY